MPGFTMLSETSPGKPEKSGRIVKLQVRVKKLVGATRKRTENEFFFPKKFNSSDEPGGPVAARPLVAHTAGGSCHRKRRRSVMDVG